MRNLLFVFAIALLGSCNFLHPEDADKGPDISLLEVKFPGMTIDEIQVEFDDHMSKYRANPNAGIDAKGFCDRTNTDGIGDYSSSFGRFTWCHINGDGTIKVDFNNYSGPATNFDVEFSVRTTLTVGYSACSGTDSYGNVYYAEINSNSGSSPGSITATTNFDVATHTNINTTTFTVANPLDGGNTVWQATLADIISNKGSNANAINFFYQVYMDATLVVKPNGTGYDLWSEHEWDQWGSYSTSCNTYNMAGIAN